MNWLEGVLQIANRPRAFQKPMSGIKVHSHRVRELLALRSALVDAHRQASPPPNPVALSSMPVKVWETTGFEVCVAAGATVNSHGEGRISHSALGRRFPTDVQDSSPRFAVVAAHELALALIAMCSDITAVAIEVKPERWRWSNPLPHGNNVLDMLVTTDVAVQVGDGGTVYVQGLDERWAPAVTGVTNYLRGVALMGERFLVVGENGCILWSDDGNDFQRAQVSPATADWFEGVAASAQRAVAVGDNGAIYTSTNGTNWTKSTSGTSEWLRGVAFGDGAFVAVGENGTILRSTSGTSWSKTTAGTAHLNRVRYLGTGGAGQF